MTEDVLRNRLSPRKSLPCLAGNLHLLVEKVEIVVGQVALRHVGVQECEILCHVAAPEVRFDHILADVLANIFGNAVPLVEILLYGAPVAGLGEQGRDGHEGNDDGGENFIHEFEIDYDFIIFAN